MMGEVPTEWVACDLCGAEDFEVLFWGTDRRHGMPGKFGVAQCRQCGHLQTNPRPTREMLPSYYPTDYTAHDSTCHRVRHTQRDIALLRVGGWWGKLVRPFAAFRFRRLVPSWVDKGSGLFLEIGCGTGWLCKLAALFGWLPVGTDISLNACQTACNLWGIATVCTDGAPLPFRDGIFQLVVLHHTLEHLPSPKTALREVHRVLRSGGWVAIEVPNAHSLGRWVFGERWDSWDLPRHLHHFTPATLQRLLEQTGFQQVRVVSARYKPFVLATSWLPRHPLLQGLRILLGFPCWLWLPVAMHRRQGEVLRAWSQKPPQ